MAFGISPKSAHYFDAIHGPSTTRTVGRFAYFWEVRKTLDEAVQGDDGDLRRLTERAATQSQVGS